MAHCHYWKIGAVTDGVAQGTCKCGATKAFDAVGDKIPAGVATRITAAGKRLLGISPPKKVRQPRKPRAVTPAAPRDGAVLLPAFSDKWQPAVQVKWLEVYAQLHIKGSVQ